MTARRLALIGFAASVALLAPQSIRAEQVTSSFDDLANRIRLGETIYVTDSAGTTIKGKLGSLSGSSVDIRIQRDRFAPPLRVPQADVNNIAVKRFDPIWNGTLIGLAIGAGAGVIIELGGRTQYQKFSGSGAISLGSLTMITGLLVDIFNREKVTVYVQRLP